MMNNILKYILLCLSVLTAVSCIENDLSYPRVKAEFTALELEGQKSVSIVNSDLKVDIVLGETADISNVKVLGYELSEGAEVVGGMPEYLDLRDTLSLTLHVYEDFVWTLSAVQPIERYIRCENQVGDAVLDLERRIAYVYVNENQPLDAVKFNSVKLEPEGSVVKTTSGFVSEGGQSVEKTEECNFPMVLDCVVLRYFNVEYGDEVVRWSVKVLHKAVEVGVESVNAWACSAGVTGVTNGEGTPVFEYRKAADSEWTSFADVSVEGSAVTADIRGLEPGTEYLIRLTNGEVTSTERKFITGKASQLENLNFDNWSLYKGKDYPNAEGRKIWDSANSSGAATTTTATDDAVEGKAAKLESVTAFGLMAAGNIFTGSFVKAAIGATVGAELDWGTPFTDRPLALRGYFKYFPKTIDKAKDPYLDQKGKTDQCQILAFLTDWNAPFKVNTANGQFVDIEKDPGIIAVGQLNTSDTVPEYVSFTLPLVYRSGSRIPKYIVIAGASSRYGDYFTGGVGSMLYLDQFELIYDPDELTEEEYAQVFSRVNPL